MRDERKTKAQLINELAELRQQVAELLRSVPAGETAQAERVRAEAETRKLGQFLGSVIESANVWLDVLDEKGNIVLWNKAAEEISGYSREEVLGHAKIWEWLYPEEEYRNQVFAQAVVIIQEGEAEAGGETTIQCKDGRSRIISWHSQRLVDEKGNLMGSVALGHDITERKQAQSQREAALEALRESKQRLEQALAELKATQEQIVQQERLAAVGQLAAGVAHDFNNLLTSIIGYTELLLMSPDMPETAQPDLMRIMKQGQRATHLVRQILDFSRKTIRQPQPLDLVPFLKEVTKFLERTIPESIHIRLEIEPVECLVQADPIQLQQMVTNLAVNARDAMPAGGELKLRLSSLRLEPDERPPCPELPPGKWVVLSVSDTGTGIPAEIMPRIFEPFFTTRAPEGSGLGLAQVYGIVKQHEGTIDVESQVGQGTTFSVYLPALAEGEQAVGEEALRDITRGSGETILLVEDEAAVLEVYQALLERLGYRVLTARDGQRALEVYAEHQDEIALILADIVMPKMDGLTLFHVLKAQSPHVKLVLITGYPLGQEAQRVLDQGIVGWLQKPMTLSQLAQEVSRALRS